MGQGSSDRKTWQSVGITEDPELLDGALQSHEESVVKTLKAVSEVFPDDPLPFDSLAHYRQLRRSLEKLDHELRSRSAASTGSQLRAERERLYQDAIVAFETDLRFSRKQQLARMALSRDWTGMPSYIRQGIAMMKCRMILRSRALLFRFHPAQETTRLPKSRTSSLQTTKTAPAKSNDYSDLRSSAEKHGLSVVTSDPIAVIRSGSLSLDGALGIGGFPRGRVTEIFGGPGTGKTTLALRVAGNAQHTGGGVAYIDVEHKLDLPWAQANGLDASQALVLRGTEAGSILASILELTRSGRFALVVVDSLSALAPSDDLETSHAEFSGELEQLLARALPRIAAAAVKTNTCILLINQIRKNEAVFGREKVSTAGEAIAHASSIRLELVRMMAQKDEGEIVGYGVKATVLKSCLAAPFRVAEWTINFDNGVDSESELIAQAIRRGLISKGPAALTFKGEHLGANIKTAREFLLANPDTVSRLEKQIRAELKAAL